MCRAQGALAPLVVGASSLLLMLWRWLCWPFVSKKERLERSSHACMHTCTHAHGHVIWHPWATMPNLFYFGSQHKIVACPAQF